MSVCDACAIVHVTDEVTSSRSHSSMLVIKIIISMYLYTKFAGACVCSLLTCAIM